MGGSGGGTSTNTTAEFKPPAYTQPYWQDYLKGTADYTSTPHQQYQGMEVAPINAQQIQGTQFLQDRALNGAPDLNAARGFATNAANGQFLNANPNSGTLNAVQNGQFFNNNPWLSNDYTNQVIGQNADTMAHAAAIGTNAQTDAASVMHGAYGGSGLEQKQAANSFALNNSIGQMANQYQLQRTGMGAQDYSQGVNQMTNAAQIGSNNYNQGVGAMQNAAQLGGQLSQDDWQAGKTLTGIGDAYQQNIQNQLNASKAAFTQQQQYPAQMLDMMRNSLQASSGGFGTNSSQGAQGYNVNPFSALLGGGAAAYGLLGGGK